MGWQIATPSLRLCCLLVKIRVQLQFGKLLIGHRTELRKGAVGQFPQFADLTEEVPEVGEICLGDVVICGRVARRQAEEYGHSYERELLYLFVHSILHLLGYDHMEEEERIEMETLQREILNELNILR